MAWKPARHKRVNADTFEIFCPYCGEQYEWKRSQEKAFADPQVCAECERTYIIPATVSRA